MICEATFSADGKLALIGGLNDKIFVWEIAENVIRQTLVGPWPTDWLDHIAISPDSSQVAGGYGRSGKIYVWNTKTGHMIGLIMNPFIPELTGLAYSSDGQFLMAGGGKISLWDPQNGDLLRVMHATSDYLSNPCVSPDSKLVAANDKEYRVFVFDVQTAEEIQCLVGHTNVVMAQCFTPDNKQLLTCSIDGTARLWDIETGRELMRLSTGSGS
jgi:WD40 repeat protein